MSEADRVRALTEAGLVHPSPEAVTSTLFTASGDFFLPVDKVQVKYEMLRAHVGRRGQRDRGGGRPRLFAGGVLSGERGRSNGRG